MRHPVLIAGAGIGGLSAALGEVGAGIRLVRLRSRAMGDHVLHPAGAKSNAQRHDSLAWL